MAQLSALQIHLQPHEQARSEALLEQLRLRIAAEGPLAFADYMDACLYTPGLGYYTGSGEIFGARGDFITAPELGALFAQGLARHIQALAAQLSAAGTSHWAILEVGAGSGQLADDLLHSLRELACTPSEYLIVERSTALRQRQHDKLRHWQDSGPSVRHVDSPPPAFIGIVIANEVLDALPVSRIRLSSEGWRSLALDWDHQKQQLKWCETPLSATQQELLQQFNADPSFAIQWAELSPPYTTELALGLRPWLRDYADSLEQGALILVDYGYPRAEFYHPQRNEGSLICYFRHQAHDDPLRIPGLQDMTAFVDFTAVAEAGDAFGLNMMGYTSQAHFLLGSGALQALEGISDPILQARLAEQARRLMLPGEMGERFQVMQLGKGLSEAGPGFTIDLSYRL